MKTPGRGLLTVYSRGVWHVKLAVGMRKLISLDESI